MRLRMVRQIMSDEANAKCEELSTTDQIERLWDFLEKESQYFEQYRGYHFDYISDRDGTRSETVLKDARFEALRFEVGINDKKTLITNIGIDYSIGDDNTEQTGLIIWNEGDMLSFGNVYDFSQQAEIKRHRSN